MKSHLTVLALCVAMAWPGSGTAQQMTRTAIDLHWVHMPRTDANLQVFDAAKVPGATIYYSLFASRNRVIRIQWDAGMFCKGTFSPGEDPLLECGIEAGYYSLTQVPGLMPQLEWVQRAPPSVPQGQPG